MRRAGKRMSLKTRMGPSLLLVIVLSGCAGLVNFASETPTAVHERIDGRPTETPLAGLLETTTEPAAAFSPSPAATSVVSTPQVSSTAIPTEVQDPLVDPESIIPPAEIQIYKPGPLSKVRSPFQLSANLSPGFNNLVRIDLIGEDGHTLVRKVMEFPVSSGHTRRDIFTEINFEIKSVAETARLQISVSDEFGRMTALSSVDLILLASGVNEYNPSGDLLENIIIQQPMPNYMVQGGNLIVSGLARSQSQKPLAIELITRGGKVVGYGQAYVAAPENSAYGLFATEIKYQVSEPSWVLVVVRERGAKIPGSAHLSSAEVVLGP